MSGKWFPLKSAGTGRPLFPDSPPGRSGRFLTVEPCGPEVRFVFRHEGFAITLLLDQDVKRTFTLELSNIARHHKIRPRLAARPSSKSGAPRWRLTCCR